jgi:cysteinyl-tRNA synthetase
VLFRSEAATGAVPFTKYWVHIGMLNLGEGKMAHSGAFIPLKQMLEKYPAAVIRLYLVSHHYRAPIAYSEEALAAIQPRWHRYVETRANLARLIRRAEEAAGTQEASNASTGVTLPLDEARQAFIAAMDDDFNTSGGLAAIDNLLRRINEYAAALGGVAATPEALTTLRASVALLDELLTGVLGIQIEAESGAEIDPALLAEIDALVASRIEARRAKQWAEADRIRKDLEERLNVVLKYHAQ